MNKPPVIPASVLPCETTTQPRITPRPRISVAVLAAVSLCILGAAAFFAYHTFASPRRSILSLVSAMGRRDRESVAEYVDAPALAESLRRCALESIREKNQAESDDFITSLVRPLGDQIVNGMAEAVFTPESVLSVLCGDSPGEAIKHAFGDSSDRAVDSLTKDGSPKLEVCGLAAKVLLRWGEGCLVDEASKQAKSEAKPFKRDDYAISGQYESPNRYLITATSRTSNDPTIGWVFKRHGIATWKFTEMRLLPREKTLQHAALTR
jgi:hypothetical protein